MNWIIIVVIALIALLLLSKIIKPEGFYVPEDHPHLKDATEHAKHIAKRYDDEYFGKHYFQFQNRDQMRKVLPVVAPLEVLKQVTEHMLILENSLFKQEQDITTQHFLTIEKAIEHAIKLDKDQRYKGILKPLLKQIQVQQEAYLTDEPPQLIAQHIRRIRKMILGQVNIFW